MGTQPYECATHQGIVHFKREKCMVRDRYRYRYRKPRIMSAPQDEQTFLINFNLTDERCLAIRVVRDTKCHMITTEPMALKIRFDIQVLWIYKHVSRTNYACQPRFYGVFLPYKSILEDRMGLINCLFLSSLKRLPISEIIGLVSSMIIKPPSNCG